MLKDSQNNKSKDYIYAALLALLSFTLCFQYIVPAVCGVYHDDAIYVITAKAIAQGDGYRLLNLPNTPVQTKYPVLYPLLLAAIWKFWPKFPQNIFYMQIMTSLIASIAIGLCYLFFLRFKYFSRFIAFTSCFVCITIPEFLYFSTNTLTELPFLFLVIVSLWGIGHYSTHLPNNKLQELSLGILIALPFLCRSVGIVLIIMGLLFYYWKNGSIRWLMLGIIVSVLPWIFWIHGAMGNLSNDSVNGYYTDYVGWWLHIAPSFLVKIIVTNLLHVIAGFIKLSADGLIALLW
ncbi:MAG: hypothetical protein P8Y99_18985, partial [Calditrichaceae bacterium]